MKLSILCENTVMPSLGIRGEHGFAVALSCGKDRYLFDTGQGLTIVENARAMKVPLRNISKIFISHGHVDHTGGLSKVLDHTGSVGVYGHPDIGITRYSRGKINGKTVKRSIGMPKGRRSLEQQGARFVFNKEFVEVAPDMYLTGEVPRRTPFEKPDRRLRKKAGTRLVQDSVADDQSLVVRTPAGLVIVLGCAHAGLINILNHIAGKLPREHIHMIIGGTHVGFLDKEQVRDTIDHLQAFSFDRIGVAHCTGIAAALSFMETFGKRFFFAHAGTQIFL